MQTVIEELRKRYEQKYGFAVFDLDVLEKKDKIIIKGQVLTQNQKDEALAGIAKGYEGRKIEDKISVLSDMKSRGIGWAIVKADLIDLRSRFVESSLMNEKISDRVRASQASKGEVLRVLLRKKDQLLVQEVGLNIGWVDRSGVTLKKDSLCRFWRKGIFAEPGKLVAVKNPVRSVIDSAEKFLDTRYVLGARSHASIDCSGLTQLAYKDAFNVILPRHSWDQKKMGKVVGLEKARTGDLVFMINKKTGTKHVGILDSSREGKYIVHASCGAGKVIRQIMEEVFEEYEMVEVRRIVK